ncbi:hypothetical protein EKK58_03980 [Candidatus Dependentiae bacterium]|nr:MAG: hypothetical protein EKK58_03980 [Candidatus Dependentiae bacterium]
MDKQHFASAIPMYTYLALKKWLYFSSFVSVLFFVSCVVMELPFVWQLYQKKTLYNKQKNIYTQEQELLMHQQDLEKNIKQLTEEKLVFAHDQQLISTFLSILLMPNDHFSVVSVKKTNQSFLIEGTSKKMGHITNQFKNIALEKGYAFHVQSIERKNNGYYFHAICYKKIKKKNQ